MYKNRNTRIDKIGSIYFTLISFTILSTQDNKKKVNVPLLPLNFLDSNGDCKNETCMDRNSVINYHFHECNGVIDKSMNKKVYNYSLSRTVCWLKSISFLKAAWRSTNSLAVASSSICSVTNH